ncbi:ABC transporter permease [Phaeobacter sp.]|uniref:ABC transporter permease n=1 Tax=Phaeobacter sp. TaxID=1902409 RepID=UPI0025F7C9CC|nr:ABC transporter permease [Phaeobacter sp.]
MPVFSVFWLETRSYVTNVSALFWTIFYPVMMLVFLILLFDPGGAESDGFRFVSVIGLTMLTLVSTAIFGLALSIGENRAHNALLFYVASPYSLFGVTLSLVLSRVTVILGFSMFFITGAFLVLGLEHKLTLTVALVGLAALAMASMFCFGVALGVARICKNSQSMLAIANIVNIYALMSSNVFVPVEVLPSWSAGFITTSPFYHLNGMLIAAFSGEGLTYVYNAGTAMLVLGLALIWSASDRNLYVAAGRAR